MPTEEEGLSHIYIDYFVAFATGNPNSIQNPLYREPAAKTPQFVLQQDDVVEGDDLDDGEEGDDLDNGDEALSRNRRTMTAPLPAWPTFDARRLRYLDWGTPENRATPRARLREVECDFWDSIRATRRDLPDTSYPF